MILSGSEFLEIIVCSVASISGIAWLHLVLKNLQENSFHNFTELTCATFSVLFVLLVDNLEQSCCCLHAIQVSS